MDWRKRSGSGNCRLYPVRASVRRPVDQCAQPQALVQLAREEQAGIGGDGGSVELDPKLGVEREANRARCRVTHWVVKCGIR